MIIINTALKGEITYDITLSGSAKYRVSAYDIPSALDLVADYVYQHEQKDLYLERDTVILLAECSRWQTEDAYAAHHEITRCGANGIYIEITSVKEGGM